MASQSRVPDSPDSDLLARAAAGDPAAFAEIFRRYQHVVYRFARAMTESAATAEDIAQDVFVAVFRDLGKYDAGRATFTTYLYGITRNVTRERLRRERRFFPLDLIRPQSPPTIYLDDPADAMEGQERAIAVRRALQKLPPRYRELILLCDVHGLNYAEAAEVVGISTAAVRSRLHRGRQLLRRRLARIAGSEQRRLSLQKGALYGL